jgi:hypothetical protein
MGRFHLTGGLCFERIGDGGVRVAKYADSSRVFDDDAIPEWTIDTTDSGWASVVATVSARDETGETWAEALAAHRRLPPSPPPPPRCGYVIRSGFGSKETCGLPPKHSGEHREVE